MKTTDYKAAKLAEYDKAFSKLLEPGDDGQYVGYYDNKHCCFIDQTKQVKAFISQTIDELDTQWRERVKDIVMDCLYEMEFEVVNAHFVPYDDKGWAKWNDERKQQLDKIDALLSEGKEGGDEEK